MRNKGFTLIELLAVIVILAIIALIATPIILGIIKDSKEQSNKRSIEMYANALKNSIAQYQLSGEKLEVGILKTTDGRNFSNIEDFKVDYDGDVVCKTIEVYEDGNIYLAECEVNNVKVEYTYGKDQSYDDGQIVYYDVKHGKGCTQEEYKKSRSDTVEDYLNSETGYNGFGGTYPQNSCLKFYAFNDEWKNTINLLLDHNTTPTISWTTPETTTNVGGPIDVIEKLYNDTNDWKGTITPTNYQYEGTNAYPINYNKEEYKARLITANEIARITGADKEPLNWQEKHSVGWYYFQDLSQNSTTGCGDVCKTDGCTYGWLYDRTAPTCTTYGCLNNAAEQTYGYWTSSAHTTDYDYAWGVDYVGNLNIGRTYKTSSYGVRPVIKVLKFNI